MAATLLLSAACSSTPTPTLPEAGTLTIGVSAAALSAAATRLAVVIDSEQPRPITDDNAVITVRGVAPGDHLVRVTGLPSGCAVEGEHPRRVKVAPRRTSAIRLAISCRAVAGY